jgi:hypothetical protein
MQFVSFSKTKGTRRVLTAGFFMVGFFAAGFFAVGILVAVRWALKNEIKKCDAKAK